MLTMLEVHPSLSSGQAEPSGRRTSVRPDQVGQATPFPLRRGGPASRAEAAEGARQGHLRSRDGGQRLPPAAERVGWQPSLPWRVDDVALQESSQPPRGQVLLPAER